MDAIDRLVAIEAIKVVKARYCRFVDTQDWPAFRALFTDDAMLEFQESMATPCPIEEFMIMVQGFVAGAVSVHHGHMPEIEIQTPDRASAIWAMDDVIGFAAGSATSGGMAALRGFGHYHETYVRQGDRWLIRTLRLTRLRLERTMQPQVIT